MSTENQAQPPLDYSNDGPAALIPSYILGFLATVIVALRFWARRLIDPAFRLDDYLVLSALVIHAGLLAASTVAVVRGGLGRDIRIVSQEPGALRTSFEMLFMAEIFYGFSSTLVKLSVLAFYRRVFPIRAVKTSSVILASICIGWLIAIQIVNLVQCRPLEAFWRQELQLLPTTHCLDPILFFMGNSIANCVIDFAILILPIREVLKLKMSTSKKAGVCGIFLLGGMASAASMTRTIFTAVMWNEGTTNFTKQFIPGSVASVVEIYVAIIGACLPTLVPVYRKLRYGDPHSRPSNATTIGRITTLGRSSNKKLNSRTDGEFERLDTDEEFPLASRGVHHVNISSYGGPNSLPTTYPDIPLEGIMVRHDMTWSDNGKPIV
ncbi:uncharacterized protein F4822DRAFT_445451 [Hypoxylon trugodes]|uniref:uncharacterized protein n=1 Tax=Hypoxylon trugodes TaxID=326681 RepID=UPI0021957CFA|nr:uncharacterized protein F4822DRAFT_445451 [Hypoxylon trugodes]KAI1385501.1 hypothetical protein F4822DRAFT_445451 [Hypoxylon trugodes]